jgi:hypothetical protein
MPHLLSLAPILSTADMDRMADHYQKLGFVVSLHGDDYATASRDGFNLHFHKDDTPPTGAVYFAVDNAEALHAEWTAAAVGETTDLFDPGFGVWEAAHTDPDGNIIRFGSPLP